MELSVGSELWRRGHFKQCPQSRKRDKLHLFLSFCFSTHPKASACIRLGFNCKKFGNRSENKQTMIFAHLWMMRLRESEHLLSRK